MKMLDFLRSKFGKKNVGSSAALEALLRHGNLSASGVSVNFDSAMAVTAVYACIRNIAENIAQVPLILYKRRKTGGKDQAVDHPIYKLLKFNPNLIQTPYFFREFMQAQVVSSGNAYAFMNRVNGKVAELLPVQSKMVEVKQEKTLDLTFNVSMPDGSKQVYKSDQILHIPGLGFDGIKGLSPITQFRNAIGLSMATEVFGSKLFSNGAVLSGTLTYPGKMSAEQKKELADSIKAGYSGADNALRVMILEQGLKWDSIALSNEDSQFLQTRKFQKSEIAAIFRMPPHMIGDLEKATFSNIEQQGLEYVVFTLIPWMRRTEEAMMKSLLTDAEREDY